ncbi:MAG TPA: D-glycerate dehydrogenase [Candidatus Obscuribacterales bacterium]
MSKGIRAFVSGKLSDKAAKMLSEFADVDMHEYDDPLTQEQIINNLRNKDVLVSVLGDKVDAEVMDICSHLKLVANVAVGFDNVHIEDATARGILVTNTPGVLDDATADLAFGLLLSCARRIVEADRFVREGMWKGWKRDLMLGHEISGKTLGIVGMGRIGQAVARRARGFGLRTIYVRSSEKDDKDEKIARELDAQRTTLDELLRRSDFISVNCPLNAKTRHLIGKKEFAMMKPNCIIVNTSRGAIIDTVALMDALETGKVAGAALDVFENEPYVPDKLMTMTNTVLTPHIGSASLETRRAMDELAVSAVIKAFSGELPPNAVNPNAWNRFKTRT